MTRTKFTTHGNGGISVEYTHPITEVRCSRTFTRAGNEIHEVIGMGRSTRTMCKHLSYIGTPLQVDSDDQAEATVKREFTNWLRAEKRAAEGF